MPFKALPSETSTLLFKLPHISNLFAFKENISNHNGMVRIITEVLRFGQLEMIFLGAVEGRVFDYKQYLAGCEDCAIIRVNLLEMTVYSRNMEVAQQQFVDELENSDNAITVDINVVNAALNANTVDIVIAPTRNIRTPSARVQAA